MPIEIFELVIRAAVKSPLKERGKSDKETHRVVIERSTHDPMSAHVQQILDRLKVKKRQLVQI